MLDERIARNFIFQILFLLAKKFNGLKAALFIARNVSVHLKQQNGVKSKIRIKE